MYRRIAHDIRFSSQALYEHMNLVGVFFAVKLFYVLEDKRICCFWQIPIQLHLFAHTNSRSHLPSQPLGTACANGKISNLWVQSAGQVTNHLLSHAIMGRVFSELFWRARDKHWRIGMPCKINPDVPLSVQKQMLLDELC